jgi:hypothetical protein
VKYCETSDPRERVFAVLGLAAQGHNIEPDYSSSRSLAELCIHTTRRIIEFDQNLDFLYYVRPRGISKDSPSPLPSWVPDWTSKRAEGQLDYFHEPRTFQPLQYIPKVLPGNVLRLKGMRIDEISERQQP